MNHNEDADIPFVKPVLTFDNVKGAEEAKLELQSLIWGLKFILRYPKYALGINNVKILLYGPRGTEKTRFELAMAMANVLGAKLIPVDCKDSQSEYAAYTPMGGPDRIKAIFAKAVENAPCVLFLNNIDAIAYEDEMDSFQYFDVAPKRYRLLSELNKRRDWLIVIAATDRMDLLDVYIYGKFYKRLEVK